MVDSRMKAKDAIAFVERMSYGPKATISLKHSHHAFDVLELTIGKWVVCAKMLDDQIATQLSVIPCKTLGKYSELEGQAFLMQMVHETIKNLELHEIDEWFKLDGKCVNDPHPELGVQFRADI